MATLPLSSVRALFSRTFEQATSCTGRGLHSSRSHVAARASYLGARGFRSSLAAGAQSHARRRTRSFPLYSVRPLLNRYFFESASLPALPHIWLTRRPPANPAQQHDRKPRQPRPPTSPVRPHGSDTTLSVRQAYFAKPRPCAHMMLTLRLEFAKPCPFA